MRPNNPSKRTRGRSRSKNANPLARSYESNGPDVKIRGSALQVADKYTQLARDAQSAGDRVMAENYYQHAEHYYRIVAQAYEQSNQYQQPRERRDDGDRPGRYDDRAPYRGGEQPTINGFDGLEDDDEGVRRSLRANGHGNGAARHDDDDERDNEPEAREHANGSVHAPIAEREEPAETEASRDAGQPSGEAAADASQDAQPGGETAKPRRRTRSTTKRTRSRATAESGDQTPAPEAGDSGL